MLYDYASGERETVWREAGWAEFGPGLRWEAGASGWREGGESTMLAQVSSQVMGWSLGPRVTPERGGAHRRGLYASLRGEAVLWGDESHQSVFADVRAFAGVLRGVLALRGTHQQVMNPEVSFFRLPSVGGMTLHRGAPFQRWRAPRITTLDLEQRWMLWGPVEGVLMTNMAWVSESGLHPAGEIGLRLLLPPEVNVSRLDLAFSDTGWGLYAAYGEAF